MLGRSPAYSDSDESIISTNSVQVNEFKIVFNLRTLLEIFSSILKLWSVIMPKNSSENMEYSIRFKVHTNLKLLKIVTKWVWKSLI